MHDASSELSKAVAWLRTAQRVVVFTGAGVSAESGIATFRDAGGFWNDFPPDEFATMSGLIKVAAAIKNGRIKIIPATAHLTMLERPAEFNAALVEFLAAI